MLPLRLRLQNTAALPTPILSLNLVQRLGGSQNHPETSTGIYPRFTGDIKLPKTKLGPGRTSKSNSNPLRLGS